MKKIYLFAVIFALIAGFSTYFFVNGLQHNAAITGVAEADVVVALQDIEPDTVVTADMFTVVRLPESSISYGTVAKASDITGWIASEKILKGEQVQVAKLTKIDNKAERNDLEYDGEYRLSYHIEKGHYAYTLRIDDCDAVAYFIRKGDFVNVYFDKYALPAPPKATPILRNVKVLEIGTYADHKAAVGGNEITIYTLITLSLTENQIKTILDYENELDHGNHFALALVPYAEGANITTLPEKTTVNENGEVEKVTLVEEPVTNRGMGEITTEPPTTTTAK